MWDWLQVEPDLGVVALADGHHVCRRGGPAASRSGGARRPAASQHVSWNADDTESPVAGGACGRVAKTTPCSTVHGTPGLRGMGTTMVLAMFRESRIYYAHVGDSRLYRVRYGRIRRLTRDHSLIQRMIDEGIFLNRTRPAWRDP